MSVTPASPRPTSAPAWTRDELRADPHASAQKPEKVRRMFASIARSYDLNNRLHSFGRDVSWRRRAVRLAGVRPGDDVLDVACGTGDLTRAFSRAGPRRVVGLDFTPEMLDIACEKSGVSRGLRPDHALPPGAAPSPEYLDGDATRLPFADASFDIVSIAFGLRNVGDPARALREFRRVLRPGGRLVVLEFGRPRNRLIAAVNGFYTARVMPVTATLISRDTSGAYRYLPRSVSAFMDREATVSAIREAGFSGVEVTPMTFGVCVCYVCRC